MSEAKIIANQQNAQKSTGPRTEEGKARTRLNGVRHGLRSKSALLPGEDAEEYFQLKHTLREEWKPANAAEEFCVEQILLNQWRLQRIALIEQDLFVQSFEASLGSLGSAEAVPEFDVNLPGALTPALLDNKLGLLTRYENSIRRAYYKATSELRSLQSERRKQAEVQRKAVSDAVTQETVARIERENIAFNQELIRMCEQIPPTPNDGHKYIQPRPSFGG